METLLLVILFVMTFTLGYVVGIIQGGIHIYKDAPLKEKDKPEYHKSVGLDEFTDYYDKTDGVNKF